MLFRILLVFDLLALAVLLYFFMDGLRYASSGYFETWAPILLVAFGVLGGAWALHSGGKTRAASALLGVIAVPPFVYLLFVLLIVITQPNWR
jgi:hypothetical protein